MRVEEPLTERHIRLIRAASKGLRKPIRFLGFSEQDNDLWLWVEQNKDGLGEQSIYQKKPLSTTLIKESLVCPK